MRLLCCKKAPDELVEDGEPVPAPADDDAGYWTSRSELRIELLERHFSVNPSTSSAELEITCVAHVTRHGYDALESRAKWLMDAAATPSVGTAAATAVLRPAADNDDADDGDVYSEQDEPDEEDDEYGSRNATRPRTRDASSDADAPSRRSRPVVGSYPGRNHLIKHRAVNSDRLLFRQVRDELSADQLIGGRILIRHVSNNCRKSFTRQE